ncbi:MAG: hypothetical protein RI964_379 [Pseudomonadota bacterium]|jgi:sirohydrochlorin ferrochelatase
MQALLIIAHGSRRAESNAEIRVLAQRVAQLTGDAYGFIGSAFLELAAPSIADGIQQCMDAGAQGITIMPFFLSAGRHVVTDVPQQVHDKLKAFPQIAVKFAPYLGVSDLMPSLIMQAAQAACQCQRGECRYPMCLQDSAGIDVVSDG